MMGLRNSNKFLYTIFIIAIACGLSEGQVPAHIVGGSHATINDFPSTVSIHYRNRHNCGGALVSKCHVLTAGHCVHRLEISGLKISAGSGDQYGFKNVYGVKKVDLHPYYKGEADFHLHDIAVITMDKCIEEGPTQKAAQLYELQLGNNVQGTVVGWGRLQYTAPDSSRFLQRIESWTITNELCLKYHAAKIVRPTQVCAISARGQGFCVGDSGGPFYVGGRVAGVVSMGVDCGAGIPDIYTRVFNYVPWVKSKITV